MPQGIILAAGTASRAHTNKLLLEFKGRFLIGHAIDGMAPFVSRIFVVTGHYHQELAAALAHEPKVTLIHNPDYEQGMFSSVLKGVAALNDDFFILPGDCPFVNHETYEALLHGQGPIRVPTFQGRSGHPMYIGHELIPALLKEPVQSNLRVFRDRYPYERIMTEDPRINDDIDTIEDYEKIAACLRKE
ncbi:MAG: nucleotidyltransferase family protein [Bacilli bacterium]|jgi:molybdenum cofactor cytidylyltransferase